MVKNSFIKDSELPNDLADVDDLVDDVFIPENDEGQEAVYVQGVEDVEGVEGVEGAEVGQDVVGGEVGEGGESRARIVPPRVMVFTTLHLLTLMAMCTDIFLDGTFKVSQSLKTFVLFNFNHTGGK